MLPKNNLKTALSLVEISMVFLIIGMITIGILNSKQVIARANCLVSTFGSKKVVDNMNNLEELNRDKSGDYEICVKRLLNKVPGSGLCFGLPCVSCKALLEENPGIASGVYKIDPDDEQGALQPFNAYCDMTTDGGGWTLVFNYLHKGGTNPPLDVKDTYLPVLGSTDVGSYTPVEYTNLKIWGQASQSLLRKFTFNELRFYGKAFSGKVIHFKTSLSGCIEYFTKGTNSCDKLNNNFTAFSDHNATLPGGAQDYMSGAGEGAMNLTPFYVVHVRHWSIKAYDRRWEVDDYDQGSGYTYPTHHQIWIR